MQLLLSFLVRYSSRAGALASVILAFTAARAGGATAEANAQPRSAAVLETEERIVIDGVLDEAAWERTADIGPLVQRQPQPGATPTEKTEVRLLRDADFLYLGITAHDSEPDKVIGTRMERDASLGADDQIEILLDTFRDQRNAYYFATNPAGALVDGLAFGNKRLNTDWDAIWDLRTRRTENGWTAEVAIPFKSLSFPQDRSVWGFNLSRTIHRKLEEDRWSGARLETDFLQIAEAGEITNMTGLNQGIGLDVRPFLAGSWLKERSIDDTTTRLEPGLDVFYNITPSLKLTGTINTDFGETEVDARQINLTRFSLFFPEKRSFFLEDVGVFDFASRGPQPPGGIPRAGADVYPFFSRRIGLFNGEEVPLDAGLKLTGKVAQTDIGFLGVRTGGTDFVESKNFFVGRFKQNLFEESYAGGIFTYGDPSPGMTARTYGVDTRLATSRFLGGSRNFEVNAFGLKADNPDLSGDDLSWGISARYPNDKWDGMIVVREIQKNFDPGLGFVQRNNVRMYRFSTSYNPRPVDFLGIQQMFHDVFYTRFERLDNGMLESSELYITPLDWHFKSGDSLHAIADLAHGFERLFEPFEIWPGVVLPAGDYKTNRFKAVFATATKRPISAFLNISWGDFWSGKAEQISAMVTFKLPPWMTLRASGNQTFARLPEGNFTAQILTSNLDFSISPRLSFSNLVQYDNRSRNLGWQSRIRWTIKPGSDLFVSFNQGWINEGSGNLRFRAEDTKFSSKLQYTFRF